jgi:hypothetical protein
MRPEARRTRSDPGGYRPPPPASRVPAAVTSSGVWPWPSPADRARSPFAVTCHAEGRRFESLHSLSIGSRLPGRPPRVPLPARDAGTDDPSRESGVGSRRRSSTARSLSFIPKSTRRRTSALREGGARKRRRDHPDPRHHPALLRRPIRRECIRLGFLRVGRSRLRPALRLASGAGRVAATGRRHCHTTCLLANEATSLDSVVPGGGRVWSDTATGTTSPTWNATGSKGSPKRLDSVAFHWLGSVFSEGTRPRVLKCLSGGSAASRSCLSHPRGIASPPTHSPGGPAAKPAGPRQAGGRARFGGRQGSPRRDPRSALGMQREIRESRSLYAGLLLARPRHVRRVHVHGSAARLQEEPQVPQAP